MKNHLFTFLCHYCTLTLHFTCISCQGKRGRNNHEYDPLHQMEVTLKTDSPPPTPVCSGSESGLGRSQECEPPTVCHQSRSQWDQSVSAGTSTILYHYYLVASLLPPTRHLDSTQSVGLDSSNTGIPSRLDWSCLLLPYQAKYWENFKICIKIQS